MIGSVAQEVRVGLREKASMPTISLGKYDLVEELDAGILGPGRLALMDEFVEGLCLPQHVHIITVSVWHTLQELVHVEMVDESLLLAFTRSWVHVASIGIEEGCEASDKGSPDLVCTESHRTDYAHGVCATAVHCDTTTFTNKLVED